MGLGCLGVPGGSQVLGGGFCAVYFRWNVERRGRIGPGSEPNYRECQGKNARQSHPENPFKKNGYRAMRLSSGGALLA